MRLPRSQAGCRQLEKRLTAQMTHSYSPPRQALSPSETLTLLANNKLLSRNKKPDHQGLACFATPLNILPTQVLTNAIHEVGERRVCRDSLPNLGTSVENGAVVSISEASPDLD